MIINEGLDSKLYFVFITSNNYITYGYLNKNCRYKKSYSSFRHGFAKRFTAKKVKVTITAEEDKVVENPIKKLRGKLKLSDKQYNDIQDFLNEDR